MGPIGENARIVTTCDTKVPNGPIHAWIVNHDDSRLFIVAYIGLAVVLSAFVSLFWLVVVVGLHLCFEYTALRHAADEHQSVWKTAIWELRLDFALIAFAMVIALYMEFAIGVAGLRLAPRLGRAVTVGSRGTARFAVWSRMLRAVFLSLDDALQVLRAVVLRRGKKTQKAKPPAPSDESVQKASKTGGQEPANTPPRWTRGDYLIGAFFAVSVVLLLLTPFLTEHTLESAFDTILTEMHPWP